MLYYSSFLFLLVSIIALIYSYYIYSLLFLFLTITSVLFYTNTKYYLLDQTAIISCVLYGAYAYYNKFKLTIGAILILYSLIIKKLLLIIIDYCIKYLHKGAGIIGNLH